MNLFPADLEGHCYHLIGIKGTGMTALAQYLHRAGAHITGSDVPEKFYTDSILEKEGITYQEQFSPANIPDQTEGVIYSAAYSPETNSELSYAVNHYPRVLTYPEALGELSRDRFSIAVAGVHGKTTTTAMIGTLIKELKLPGSVIVGSGVRNFDGSQVLYGGKEFLVAETCEYRRHFLNFHPDILLVTSIEPDHLDYFKDYNDIFSAFTEYVSRLPENGILVYCGEDKGACSLAEWTRENRPDISVQSYGSRDNTEWSLADEHTGNGATTFILNKWPHRKLSIHIPGHHSVLNAAGSIAAVYNLSEKEYSRSDKQMMEASAASLDQFGGTNRRSEILFKNNEYLIMDDYAHHPTAVRFTLDGIKQMYPGRRLIVSFMSHTYSRTTALFNEFAESLQSSDILFLHKIYASAREVKNADSVEGTDLFEAFTRKGGRGYYIDDPGDAEKEIMKILKPGDIFITLGAGNNWVISHGIAANLESQSR